MERRLAIGILHSQDGPYGVLGRVACAGILRGVDEVNADPALRLRLTVRQRNPAGRLDRYAPLCRELLQDGVQHIFGCITSSSRKEVIPELERLGGTLWYAAPHEGFEASEQVAYMHACPNQHLLPLLDWALASFGTRACLVGANYIWGWEIARIARERILAAGGRVLSDRYLAIEDCDSAHLVAEIAALRPDFVLNSLIGPGSYAFLRRLRAQDAGCNRLPVLSANFTEVEIGAAEEAAEGLYAAGPWFEDGAAREGSIAEMSRLAVHELAVLLQGAPGARPLPPLGELLATAARQGRPLRLDPATQHARHPVVIARSEAGRFRPILQLPSRAADPYLTGPDARPAQPLLRVVR